MLIFLYFSVIVVGWTFDSLSSMGEEKPDTLDFVKDFQEYLSQQTQHVNMISGSVSGVKEADELPPGNSFSAVIRVGIYTFYLFDPFLPGKL